MWKKNILAILFFLIVMFIALKGNWDYRNRTKTGLQVVGTVYSGFKNIKWVYEVDGVHYKTSLSKSHYPFIEDGEQYVVYYDEDNPSLSTMSFVEPIIDTALFDKTLSLPFSGNYGRGSQVVEYSYVVNGDTIIRNHRYKFLNDFKANKEVATVYFKKSNPRISYIELEK